MEEHLARYRAADLFLDTLPYNAHTTASDALWAGLPVVTCAGETFAARVAGSLLHAVGLPELVTHTLADYEALALHLAGDPAALRALRDRLDGNRLTAPLFDTERYARNLEAAYMEMVRLRDSGQQPQAFAVADLPQGDAAPAAPARAEPWSGRIAYPACPLCGSADIPFHIEADTTRHALYKPAMPRTMKWRSCAGCAHVFTEGHYTEEMLGIVFSGTQANQRVGYDIEGQRKVSARIVERVAARAGIGDWLDVGFGNASLLFTAAEWGFTPVGVDLRKDNVETLRKLGMEAHCLPIESMDGADGRYSVISMADVLEHMPYPKDGLAAACRLLRPGGVLFVSMPNMDSMAWRVLDASGSNPYWGEIEHYHNFTRARLYALLEEHGISPVHYDISERYRCCMEVIAVKW
jgi:SAM-dependent methyltransferase